MMVKNDRTEYLLRLKGTTYSFTTPALLSLIELLKTVKESKKPTNWIPVGSECDHEQKGLFDAND